MHVVNATRFWLVGYQIAATDGMIVDEAPMIGRRARPPAGLHDLLLDSLPFHTSTESSISPWTVCEEEVGTKRPSHQRTAVPDCQYKSIDRLVMSQYQIISVAYVVVQTKLKLEEAATTTC
jgi:hypothetical protein